MITVPKGSNIYRASELGFAPGFITEHMMAHAECAYPESEAEMHCHVAIDFLNALPFSRFEELLDESWKKIFELAHCSDAASQAEPVGSTGL